MKAKNKSMLQFAVTSIVIVLSLLLGLVVYYDDLVANLQQSTCRTLEEVLQQEKHTFTQTLYSDRDALKGYAELITTSMQDEESLLQFLGSVAKSTNFEYVTFAQPNGTTINNAGEKTNLAERTYFLEALTGKTVISEPLKSKLRNVYIIAIATPVFSDGKVIGVLIGSMNAAKLNKLFMGAFDGRGYTYVSTNEGALIAKTESDYTADRLGNLFESFEAATFYKNDSYEAMRQKLLENKGGHSQYRVTAEQRRLMHYDKLPINNWNIFAVVNPTAVDRSTKQILRNTVLLTTGLLLIFVLLLLYNLGNQKRFTRELTKMAYVDEVTGYSSFGKFKIDAGALIGHSPKDHQMLVKMDIENFKLINEIYSVEVGNQILQAEANALDLALNKQTDAFGRIHADEFILLVSYDTEEERLSKRAIFDAAFGQICDDLIAVKLVLPQGSYKLQKEDTDFAQSYEKANFAHRLAKNSDSKELDFDGKVKERALREKEFENRMENALLNGEFQMFLQPKYRLDDEEIVGAEALVRWFTKENTVVSPGEFIPLFEKNGFICRLDLYMFEQTCAMLKGWIEGGITPVTVSVNFSRLHLSNPTFVAELTAIADQYKVPYHLLEVELTETAMLDNLAVLEDVLAQLHDVGFTLSMDDFGTGYSSLGLLKNIPVDVIKIDKAFFDQSKDFARAKTVISCVLSMAKKLDICTVAEGVETQDHIDFLRELGCETVQGFYYAKPMPAIDLEVQLMREALTRHLVTKQ